MTYVLRPLIVSETIENYMSYDLMVFESAVPPKGRAAFMEWFQTQTKWNEAHNYRDHAVTTEPLKAWFMDIIKQYPPISPQKRTLRLKV